MDELTIPNHVGFIIDGNRRWAKKHGLPTYEGHLAGYNAIKEVAFEALRVGVKYMTIYAFSTENWSRDEDEVSKIMNLMLKLLTADLPLFEKNNVKLKVLGSRDKLSDKIVESIKDAEAKTAKNTAGTLAVCFNYGGQLEIADAVKKIIQAKIPVDEITPAVVEQNLYSPEIPAVDLVVRTSGEQRISNFMLWRIAYSEFLFLDKFWPDMRKEDVSDIIKEFSKRSRRLGK